jgi:hypothetical protein
MGDGGGQEERMASAPSPTDAGTFAAYIVVGGPENFERTG